MRLNQHNERNGYNESSLLFIFFFNFFIIFVDLPGGWLVGGLVTGGLVGADVAADQAGLVAVDAFQSHELGGEMVAVDRFLAAVAHRTRQVTEAPAAVADCLLSNALVATKNLPQISGFVQFFNQIGVPEILSLNEDLRDDDLTFIHPLHQLQLYLSIHGNVAFLVGNE